MCIESLMEKKKTTKYKKSKMEASLVAKMVKNLPAMWES